MTPPCFGPITIAIGMLRSIIVHHLKREVYSHRRRQPPRKRARRQRAARRPTASLWPVGRPRPTVGWALAPSAARWRSPWGSPRPRDPTRGRPPRGPPLPPQEKNVSSRIKVSARNQQVGTPVENLSVRTSC